MSRSLIRKRNSWCLSGNLLSARRQATISKLVRQFDTTFIQPLWILWEGEEGFLGLFRVIHLHSKCRWMQDVVAQCHPTASLWRSSSPKLCAGGRSPWPKGPGAQRQQGTATATFMPRVTSQPVWITQSPPFSWLRGRHFRHEFRGKFKLRLLDLQCRATFTLADAFAGCKITVRRVWYFWSNPKACLQIHHVQVLWN